MKMFPPFVVKTCYVPTENANVIFPLIQGKGMMDMIWVWRPFPWWKKIHRGVYLKKLRKFRNERRRMMEAFFVEYNEQFTEDLLVFGVKDNKALSLWEMVRREHWRKNEREREAVIKSDG